MTESDATDEVQTEIQTNGESNRPDYIVKQYRQVRTENGSKTRKEAIGAIWKNAATGMLTIRYNGVQVISNDVFAYPNEPSSTAE